MTLGVLRECFFDGAGQDVCGFIVRKPHTAHGTDAVLRNGAVNGAVVAAVGLLDSHVRVQGPVTVLGQTRCRWRRSSASLWWGGGRLRSVRQSSHCSRCCRLPGEAVGVAVVPVGGAAGRLAVRTQEVGCAGAVFTDTDVGGPYSSRR